MQAPKGKHPAVEIAYVLYISLSIAEAAHFYVEIDIPYMSQETHLIPSSI
jgi:hypothetical protein